MRVLAILLIWNNNNDNDDEDNNNNNRNDNNSSDNNKKTFMKVRALQEAGAGVRRGGEGPPGGRFAPRKGERQEFYTIRGRCSITNGGQYSHDIYINNT